MNRYDAQTALVVVDLQNDFADPNGSIAVVELVVDGEADAILQPHLEAEAYLTGGRDGAAHQGFDGSQHVGNDRVRRR